MAPLYENYIAGDDYNFTGGSPTFWAAQTFTPSISHTITSVKLLLYKVWTPAGIVTVRIRATDASGLPTGPNLASGTTDGNTLPTGSPYEWREISLGLGTNLLASIKYAIVVNCDISDTVVWRRDSTDATYTGGNICYSEDSGVTWTEYMPPPDTANDVLFEDWGEPLAAGRSYGYIIG